MADIQFYVSKFQEICRKMKELTPEEIAQRDKLALDAKPLVAFEDENLKLRLSVKGLIILETKRPCLWSGLKPRVTPFMKKGFIEKHLGNNCYEVSFVPK